MRLNPSINFDLNIWSNPAKPFTEEEEEWIEKSYQDPDFWTTLIPLQKKISPTPPTSLLEKEYDFYHDLVLRHMESNSAFVFIEEGGFTTPWNYKKLHKLVNYQVKKWSNYALKPGSLIIITTTIHTHFLLALLTALRLGLTICYLPHDPAILTLSQIIEIIDKLHPALVVTDPHNRSLLLSTSPIHTIDELLEEDQNHLPLSHPYEAKTTLQLSLALQRTNPYTIVPLDAQTCYLHALRDGFMIYNLKPEVSWATPLASQILSEPCHTLASLICGATKVCIADEILLKDPELLKEEKIHLLGVSAKLLKEWPKNLSLKTIKGIYTSPTLFHTKEWKSFLVAQNLEKIPVSQIWEDNSSGGVVFFSKPAQNSTSLHLKPNLGASWSVKDLRSQEVSLSGFGQFSLDFLPEENRKQNSNFLFAFQQGDGVMSGTLAPCVQGVTIPIKKIESAIAELPFVESCMLHPVKMMGSIFTHRLVLLVFIDPLKNELLNSMPPQWREEISLQIGKKIGTLFCPDIIEFYALAPKIIDSSIDRDWCAEQYDRGMLSMKRKTQFYLFLSIVRKLARKGVLE